MNLSFKITPIILGFVFVDVSHGQDASHLSLQTIQITKPTRPNAEKNFSKETVTNFKKTVGYWIDYANENGDPGGVRAGFKKYVNPAIDGFITGLDLVNPAVGTELKLLVSWRDWVDENILEADAKEYRRTRDFQIRETFEATATKIVSDHCKGDVSCADAVFKALTRDPQIQKQFEEANAFGAFDEARTRAFTKEAIDAGNAKYTGTILAVQNMESTVLAAVNNVRVDFAKGLSTINNNQKVLINNVAKIYQIEQEHTIALENLQNTMEVGINNITELQQKNLFISEAILDGVINVDAKVTELSNSFSAMREEQRIDKIHQIFENSPIAIKIQELRNAKSTISQTLNNTEREKLLKNLESIKLRQDIVAASTLINEWGEVGKKAIELACKSCPPELVEGINVSMAIADVAGNVASGNYAKAAMTVLGIFGEPKPSPELVMLQQVSKQIKQLESNMNAQFKAVHQQLFAMEENLGKRLDIIEYKLNEIQQQAVKLRIDLMEGLSKIDAKLNYIINQNECTKELILSVTLAQGQDICKGPVADFKKWLASKNKRNFDQLSIFFRASNCENCVKSLLDLANTDLVNSPLFRYAQCNEDGQDNKAKPDRVYDFIYQKLLSDLKQNDAFVNSLLFLPENVQSADSLQKAFSTEMKKSVVSLNDQDRFYRNYNSVIDYADYVLTMFTFLELYDKNQLLPPNEIEKNKEFSTQRAAYMLKTLQATLNLINHTIVQQSLMAGIGIFSRIDIMLSKGTNDAIESENVSFSLTDLFTYNPYVRKNYASYLMNKEIGKQKLFTISKNNGLIERQPVSNFRGHLIKLERDKINNPAFSVFLVDPGSPAKDLLIFNSFTPISKNGLDENVYNRFLAFSYPSSLIELYRIKAVVTEKIAEMLMITSPALDKEGAEFSRKQLEDLILANKN